MQHTQYIAKHQSFQMQYWLGIVVVWIHLQGPKLGKAKSAVPENHQTDDSCFHSEDIPGPFCYPVISMVPGCVTLGFGLACNVKQVTMVNKPLLITWYNMQTCFSWGIFIKLYLTQC